MGHSNKSFNQLGSQLENQLNQSNSVFLLKESLCKTIISYKNLSSQIRQ